MTLAEPDLLLRGGLALDVDRARATITLSRPDSLNAQGRAFSAGLDRGLFTPTPDRPGIAALGTCTRAPWRSA